MRRTALLALVLVLSLAAAIPSASTTETDPPALRVAVLIPFVADALDGADGSLVVASVRRSLREPIREGRIDVGNPHSPSFERLAEARPDLVIGDRTLHQPLADRLSLGGRAKVMLIDTGSVDATFEALRAIARSAGVGEAVSRRVADVSRSLGETHVPGQPAVLALFGTPDSFYAVTERNWIGDLAVRVGFRNVVTGLADDPRFPGLVALNDETVAGLQPELVVLICHGDPANVRASLESRIGRGGVWSHLGAAVTRGIHVLDPALFSSNPGLGLADAARSLAALSAAPADRTTP
jgi:iron complex transport system substrate-binding protein